MIESLTLRPALSREGECLPLLPAAALIDREKNRKGQGGGAPVHIQPVHIDRKSVV